SSGPGFSSPTSSKVEAPISLVGSPDSKAPSNTRVLLKRPLIQYALPSDELSGDRPRKKARTLLTTTSARRSKEVEDLHSNRMLELARASYDAFLANANERYHRQCIREIDVMRTIACDEYEEVMFQRKRVERQVGEVQHMLNVNGTALLDSQFKRFPADDSDNTPESGGESDVDSCPHSPA
ncbi:hypothetical protein BS17DRAFT_791691, partial [Gyrodon lividus]